MADINSVILVGRLTRDAELKYTANGQGVCKFSVAINRRKKNGEVWEDEPNFFDVVLWGRQGEALNQYLLKGKAVGIQGELRQDRWQQDGQNRSRVEIVANNIQLLGGGPQGGGGPPPQGGSGNYGGAGPAYGTSTPAPAYNGGPSYGGGGVPYQGGRGAGRASPPAEDDHSYDDVPF